MKDWLEGAVESTAVAEPAAADVPQDGKPARTIRPLSIRGRSALSAATLKRLLLLGDVVAVFLAGMVTELTLGQTGPATPLRLLLLLAATIVGIYVVEGYELVIYRDGSAPMLRMLVGTAFSVCLVMPVALVLPGLGFTRPYAVSHYVLFGAVLLVWRNIGARYLRSRLAKMRVVLIGAGRVALDLLHSFESSDVFEVVDVLDDDPARQGRKVNGHTVSGGTNRLPEIVQHRGADMVALAVRGKVRTALLRTLVACRYSGLEVLDMASAYEYLANRLPVSYLNLEWVAFSSRFGAIRHGWEAKLKRLADVMFATAALIAFAPLMLLVAVAIRLTSKGPVIYRQIRVGFHAEPFVVLKFRSMKTTSEADGTPRWAQDEDPRVTLVGRVLRKTHLDELPQLWNVLRGDMSLVGPRPERPEFVELLRREVPYYDLRHMTKPGLTGWAQIQYPYGACVADAVRKLEYDLYYIRHQSMGWDIRIMLRTAAVAVTGRGSR